MNIVRVAIDVPLPTLFDYRVDGADDDDIGACVVVPFGKRQAVGIVVEVSDCSEVPSARLRRVQRFLREVPPLPREILELARFCSDYYHHPLGEVLVNALPVALRRPPSARRSAPTHFRLTVAGRAVRVDEVLPARALIKRRLMASLAQQATLDLGAVRALSPRGPAALKTLVDLGWVEACDSPPIQIAAQHKPTSQVAGPALTPEQVAAVAAIRDAGPAFSAWVLYGVTGSGKTEVYFQLIGDVLATGGQVLVLVPEINLTPQLAELFRARFGHDAVATLHSGLAESERSQNWIAAATGHTPVVLGTRLAVFAPLPRLALVVIDEEHDGSFKQAEGLRYSARDVAIWRARRRNIPIVLGSATPSLETLHNARSGRYRLLLMRQRASGAFPAIETIDLHGKPLREGLSPRLLEALGESLAQGEQSLVFINRRGYAPTLACRACGWAAECHRCSARLVLHHRQGGLRCHHCGHRERPPAACPSCGNQDLAPLGQGTQRIEEALTAALPAARVLRIDRDSTRRKDAWGDMRNRIRGGEVDILVGTQILAKGHDFPNLNLVGVVNADSALFSTDFRAAERLFALLTQVAGRAGRGERPGRVLIQTEFPTHPLYRALHDHDHAAFAETLLAERQQAGFPPYVFQALLRAEAPRADAAIEFLAQAARAGAELNSPVTIYDPVPATLARLAGTDRAQLLVQAGSRADLQKFLTPWVATLRGWGTRNVRWTLDVDPQEF